MKIFQNQNLQKIISLTIGAFVFVVPKKIFDTLYLFSVFKLINSAFLYFDNLLQMIIALLSESKMGVWNNKSEN